MRFIWKGRHVRRVHFEVASSTNTEARRLATAKAELLLVTAVEQTAGRGQRGRTWSSPKGGAWMSLVWPMAREPRHYAAASLVAAVGVRRGLLDVMDAGNVAWRAATGVGAIDGDPSAAGIEIKWPNDLLIGDRKVAGILCEQVLGGDAKGVLIVGVGVNVHFDLALLGPERELRHPPVTLASVVGRPIDPEEVVEKVATRLAEALAAYERVGFASVLAELREHLAYVGEMRSWAAPGGVISGRVRGLDESGRLLLETERGIEAMVVGDWSGAAE